MKQIKNFLAPLITPFFIALLIISCKKPQTKEQEVVPITPSDLTVILVSNTQATLNWVDKSTNEAGFKVERKIGNGTFGVIATTNADITTINDAGLTPNTTYTYRVYSFNNTGKSLSYTNEVTITTISLATVTTTPISDTTGVSAVSGGNITSDGGSAVTARGIVWGTSPAPTVSLATKTTDGSGSGQFSSKMEGLSKSTKYYVRAYATNTAGTAYGNELSFTTLDVDLVTGLLAYYPFNGNANDSTSNALNGIVNGAQLTTDRFNRENSAYLFNGSSNNIFIDKLFFDVGSDNYSISFWYYLNQISNPNSGGFLSHVLINTSPHTGFAFDINWGNTGKYSIFLGRPSIGQWTYFHNATSTSNAVVTQWKHITLVKNQNIIKLYIDGKLDQTWTSNSTILSGLCKMYFGSADPNSAKEYFNGKLDDIRFYTRGLTELEINYLSKN